MNTLVEVRTYRGGAAHRWQSESGNGSPSVSWDTVVTLSRGSARGDNSTHHRVVGLSTSMFRCAQRWSLPAGTAYEEAVESAPVRHPLGQHLASPPSG